MIWTNGSKRAFFRPSLERLAIIKCPFKKANDISPPFQRRVDFPSWSFFYPIDHDSDFQSARLKEQKVLEYRTNEKDMEAIHVNNDLY